MPSQQPTPPAHNDADTADVSAASTPQSNASGDAGHTKDDDGGSGGNGKIKVIIAVVVVLLAGFVAYGLYHSKQTTQKAVTLQGQMDMQQSAIASKVAGRVSDILVSEGDRVKKGEQLIEMDSPEITAKINQARAGQQAAQSQVNKANNGARPEQIAQAKAGWQANQAEADLAKNTYQRVQRLYQEGLMSQQKSEEARTKYLASEDKAQAAYQQYLLAKQGTRSEDKDAAKAQLAQVNAKLDEAMVAQDEANLKSPIAGIVDTVIINPGEVVGKGVPILNLVDPNDQWVVLNVTEDHLSQFAIGNQFKGIIPALSRQGQPYQQTFTVYASSSLSDFATWRPTNSDNGFDVRRVVCWAHPAHPDPKIRAGMSVLVSVPPSSQTND